MVGSPADRDPARVASVSAAVVRDPTPFGRASNPQVDLEAASVNPMVSAGSSRGAVARFGLAWGEVACVVSLDVLQTDVLWVGGALPLAGSYRSTPGKALPAKGGVVPVAAPGFGIEIALAGIEAASR